MNKNGKINKKQKKNNSNNELYSFLKYIIRLCINYFFLFSKKILKYYKNKKNYINEKKSKKVFGDENFGSRFYSFSGVALTKRRTVFSCAQGGYVKCR